MACAHSINIVLFEELNIPEHLLFTQRTTTVRTKLMAINSLKYNALAVELHYVVLRVKLKMTESKTSVGFLNNRISVV